MSNLCNANLPTPASPKGRCLDHSQCCPVTVHMGQASCLAQLFHATQASNNAGSCHFQGWMKPRHLSQKPLCAKILCWTVRSPILIQAFSTTTISHIGFYSMLVKPLVVGGYLFGNGTLDFTMSPFHISSWLWLFRRNSSKTICHCWFSLVD